MKSQAIQRRFRNMQELGCICCLIEGVGYQAPDIHHIVDNGYRRLSGGDAASLPLYPYHHRGLIPEGMTHDDALFRMGPSLALHKKRFIETYGTERELLEIVNEQLAIQRKRAS